MRAPQSLQFLWIVLSLSFGFSSLDASTAVGSANGSALVRRFNTSGGLLGSIDAFPGFTGGVRVAAGDVNGDGTNDIVVGTGPGAAQVKVFDGVNGSELRNFLPYSTFTGGVFVAAGDINGDGRAEVITAVETGGSHIKAFDGVTNAEVRSFFAFPGFTGGVRVATGDINGDGRADIIVGSGPGAAHVKVFDGVSNAEIWSFFAYTSYTGGVFVGAADINRDGKSDIITGREAGDAHVKVFDGVTNAEVRSFFAFTGFTGGVRVAGGDVNGDGRADLVVATGPGANQVKLFDGASGGVLGDFTAFAGDWGVHVGQLGFPLQVGSAVSRKQHGAAGVFDLPLPFPPILGIEPRSGGTAGAHTVVVRFTIPVFASGASVSSGQGSVGSMSGNGSDTLVLNLTGVANAQRLTVTLDNVNNGSTAGDVAISMGLLLGDINGTGTITSSDIGQAKSLSGQTANATNFPADLNVSGSINATDVGLAKSNSGMSLP